MPLVRVEVRNEYGLGMPELYTETKGEDPKAVLQVVSVAGLVGILRQLGDLSDQSSKQKRMNEVLLHIHAYLQLHINILKLCLSWMLQMDTFAAEVFHGIQEQVLITSSRSEKLGERLYNVEAALPLLEKAILSQRSHLHFAYTSGSQWHTRLRTEQNHFIYSDLPLCIMDSYEGCHDPPRLHKLDKFDTDGRGSCFKRYSDPTYLRRASAGPCGTRLQSAQGEKKAQRSKKERSLARHRDMTRDAPIFMHDGGMDLPSRNCTGKTSHSLDVSTIHVSSKSGIEHKEPEMEDCLTSFNSRNGSGFIECIFHPRYSTQSEENETKEMSSDSIEQQNAYLGLAPFHENYGVSDEIVENSSNSHEGSAPRWSFVTWDEKLEIVESTEILCTEDELDAKESEELSTRVDLIDFDFHDDHLALSVTPNEIAGDMHHYMGALNIIASGSETNACCQTKRELKQYSSLNNKDVDGKLKESNLDDRSMNFESHVPESTYSTTAMSSKQISYESQINAHMISNSKSDLLENTDEATLPQVAGTSLISLTCTDNFISEKPDTNVGPVVSNELFSSSSRLDSSSKQIITRYGSPKKPLSTSGLHTNPIMFWTNGGLLGLAPSKPPDFGVVGQDDLVQQEHTIEDDEHVARADTVGNSSKYSKFPGGNSSSHFCNASSRTAPAATDGPIAKSVKENGISSSRIFDLRNRLFVNGLQRQVSFVEDEKTQTAMGKPLREEFGDGSSPPLEHMRRISFQAMDGCKLKLKFCNWHGSMFELAHESETDSDNTFYRSPYASDECHSESNSEQWDSPTRSRKEDDDGFISSSSYDDGLDTCRAYSTVKRINHKQQQQQNECNHRRYYSTTNLNTSKCSPFYDFIQNTF
ncbi:hypothetical protein L6452_31357 [Arctium lappa]|uniref:Uncharacterized protein n=1 Tax=Arctium lappa TaxID=4217 RepID=A0ACB8ZLQ4_ARCLA|nr:hypothetical protein L6452_31357 [Arctium lappa]